MELATLVQKTLKRTDLANQSRKGSEFILRLRVLCFILIQDLTCIERRELWKKARIMEL